MDGKRIGYTLQGSGTGPRSPNEIGSHPSVGGKLSEGAFPGMVAGARGPQIQGDGWPVHPPCK